MRAGDQTFREKIIANVDSFKSRMATESKFLYGEIDDRNLNRVPLYLFIGYITMLVSSTFPQDSILQETGTGVFTATTVFSLHEILHSRIRQTTDKITQTFGYFRKMENYKPHIIAIFIVLIDILVSLPMFAYGEYSNYYTRWVTTWLILFGALMMIGWIFLDRIDFYSFAQEMAGEVDEKSNAWNHMVGISLVGSGLIVIPVILTLFLGIGISFIRPDIDINILFLFISASILPFIFIDIYHYMSIVVFVYAEYIVLFAHILGRFIQLYSIFVFSAASVIWIFLLLLLYINLVGVFSGNPPNLVMRLMGISWVIIGIMGVLPYLIRTCQILTSRIRE